MAHLVINLDSIYGNYNMVVNIVVIALSLEWLVKMACYALGLP